MSKAALRSLFFLSKIDFVYRVVQKKEGFVRIIASRNIKYVTIGVT